MAIYGENVKVAVTAMMQLASLGNGCVASLTTLSKEESLSISFLEQLFSKLKQRGLLDSKRGIYGGYSLKKPPREITLFQIIEAIESSTKITRCKKGSGGCLPGGHVCLTHKLWRELEKINKAILNTITLDDLINGRIKDLSSTLILPNLQTGAKE
jgi:Rrf2 family iron-sulfur cluster assembly transcriptional regulator